MNEDAIFARAIALPPDQREEFLRRVCGDEEALQTRIEALLKAHEALSEVQQSVDVELVSTSDPASAGGQSRRSVGPYKLLQPIGEGGMGIVYLAEQTEPVKRRVAVKIIKPGMDSREVLARFEAECQALAMMDHPNIAHVLDAGTTAEGQPYFAMELVKGLQTSRSPPMACDWLP